MRLPSLLLVLRLWAGLLLLGLAPTVGQEEEGGPAAVPGGGVGALASASRAETGEESLSTNYLSWHPPGDKFLLIDCIRGQVSQTWLLPAGSHDAQAVRVSYGKSIPQLIRHTCPG